MIDRQSRKAARQALLLGVLGVTIFGLTLPATRLAVAELDPLFVTAGRSLLAAALASRRCGPSALHAASGTNGRGSPHLRPSPSSGFRC